MRPVDVKKIKYRDTLATNRRRRIRLAGVGIIALVIALIVGAGYALFYTSWLRTSDVVVEGLNQQHTAEARQIVDRHLDHNILGVPVGRNLFFLRRDDLVADLNELSFLAGADIQKDFPHTLTIIGTERQSEGVWCIKEDGSNPLTTGCRYFDRDGVVWGQAALSSGFLFLSIDDRRAGSFSTTVDLPFLSAIRLVRDTLDEHGIKTKQVIIPTETFTEFDVVTGDGYPIKFSLDSNIAAQLEIYFIFRDQKVAKGGFNPQYVDMRFDGRVYFK